ncbi:Putative dioxygenase C576,01c [Talaromyces islandicus]|uniref:Putative dioxygenase C576,01c n=1 Tax=Talaromyces islandicus TaxID=28573 RepID=A0A0U1LYN1_TALIS|nr:Putative dioxygenase C576,01c [Talaromyces islandicus]
MVAPTVQPVTPPKGSSINFGSVITGLDVENLSGSTPWNDDDFQLVYDTLYRTSVVVIKSKPDVSAKAQYELTRRFDPSSTAYGHGKTLDAKRSILHPDLKTVPHQPQVQIIGNGFVKEYEGLKDITLRHPHHRTFHRDTIPDAEDLDFTRYYRWHIDAALYDLDPPLVTTLLAVSLPPKRRQTVRYDDGTGNELDVSLGTTAFVSGYQMYDRLSEEDKEFVRTSRIEYAAHPYIWMSKSRALSTGLGLHSENLELDESELPPIDPAKIKVFPMLWKNPVTDQLALQIHPSAIRRIFLKDGTTIDDLEEVRNIVYRLQRPAISPEFVYAHDWEEGDMVLFNNHGVLHSVVGAFDKDEVRLFRQCNLSASRPPLGP